MKVVARKFVQDVGILTVANLIGAGLNLVQGILVARWLGPELYGVAALVMTYPGLVYAVFDARSVAASVKYLGEYHARGEADRALAMCGLGYAVDLAVACLTFLVLVFTARLAAESIVHDPAVAGLMILYGAALIPRALVGTSNAILATLGRFPFIASIEIVTTVLRAVLLVGLVLGGWQVAGVVWANTIAVTATGLLYGAVAWVLIRRTWGGSVFQGKLKALKGERRQIFAFLAYNDLNALVGIIPKQLDTLLLGYFRNPTEVGYYKLAKSLSSVTGYLAGPLKSVAYPELARLWGLGRRRAFSRNVRQLAIWIAFPLGMAVLVGSAFMSFALPLLVGESYLPAVGAAQLLFIGSAISIAFFWLRLIYLAKGHVRQLFILNSSVTGVFTLIYPFVVRDWGYMGASACMLARYVVANGVSGYWLWKDSKKKEKHGDVTWRGKQTQTIEKTGERLAESVPEKT
ncbi:MAG: oligosaccharide flippase family protein [Deltaproteobacteria bacterium]|nr:oligosaccharide flippase family protein [Deltaproteobacteria bacterium]